MDLTTDEHQMLKTAAAAASGRFAISGLSSAQMQHAADVASALESMGLVSTLIHKSNLEADQPVDRVLVELTKDGRRYLAEQE